jgi:hypothetical protein
LIQSKVDLKILSEATFINGNAYESILSDSFKSDSFILSRLKGVSIYCLAALSCFLPIY